MVRWKRGREENSAMKQEEGTTECGRRNEVEGVITRITQMPLWRGYAQRVPESWTAPARRSSTPVTII